MSGKVKMLQQIINRRLNQMAIFKSGAEKVLEMFNKLSDEDKELVKSKMGEKAEDLEKAEDEREIDKVEEEKAETETEKDEKAEEVKEESEEIGKDVDETETEEKEEEQGEIAKAEEKTEDAHNEKMEALIDELNVFKDKVNKLYEMLEITDRKDEKIGLSRQSSVETAEDDDTLSARDYAMKYAKY